MFFTEVETITGDIFVDTPLNNLPGGDDDDLDDDWDDEEDEGMDDLLNDRNDLHEIELEEDELEPDEDDHLPDDDY